MKFPYTERGRQKFGKGHLARGRFELLLTSVMCDESGHTKFPFSYLEHVTLLTLAQARLSPCSEFAQAGSPLLTLMTIFGRLRHRMLNRFNPSRGGPELVSYIRWQKCLPFLKFAVLCVCIPYPSIGDFYPPSLTLTPFRNTPTIVQFQISRQTLRFSMGTGTKDVIFSKYRY